MTKLVKKEYTEVSTNSLGIKNKLQMMIGGNGDYYLTVYNHEHNSGPTIRLETSGGASTKNHEMMLAIALLYKALDNDKEDFWDTIHTLSQLNKKGK